MNRRERRQRRIARAYLDRNMGVPIAGACRDCQAYAVAVAASESRVIVNIYHSAGCPAAAGIVPWAPVPSEAS